MAWRRGLRGVTLLTMVLFSVGINGPDSLIEFTHTVRAAASPTPNPSKPQTRLNRVDLAKLATPGPTIKSSTTPATGQAIGPLPKPIAHPVALPMRAGLIDLDPSKAVKFVGSDGRFEIDVPAGAVTAADLAAAGGRLQLSVKQVAPASGGTGGGSGHYSFGTFLVQTVDGQKHEWGQPLRKALTFKLHIGPEEYALDLRHPYLVFNAEFPVDTNFNPDPSTPAILAGQAHLTHSAPVAASFDSASSTLVATTSMPADPTAAFNTDSPVATFGKPDIFSADLSAGSLSATYPLDLPAGPAGFTPPLSLSYSSAAVNEQHNPQGAVGWVGEGWSLSLGSISWAEHNVPESTLSPNWENTWQLSDPYGTSVELIPPYTNVHTFCGTNTNVAPSPPPITWHTAPEEHIKVIEISGGFSLNCGGSSTQNVPCFRVFLADGVMEEFGCTQSAVQYYPLSNGTSVIFAVNQWLLDLIQDPKGNQIRVNYTADSATSLNQTYPRDIAIKSVEYGSPGCTQSSCALKQVLFNASSSVAHPAGATCANGGSPRCDDPTSVSGGMTAPLIQNTFVLNDILVQVRSSGSSPWNTLRDYQLSYEQTGPGQITDPATGAQESVAGRLLLTQIAEIGNDGTQEATRTYSYQSITNYYEDDWHQAANTSACPSWVPNGDLCSQSYSGNSYYLSSANNGLGLTQSFSWGLARNNTVVGNTDPFYCNTTTANGCTLADDQNWSRVVIIQESDSNAGSLIPPSSTTYKYLLANLAAHACAACTVGYTWGNRKDADYSDYYNGKFMGFALVTITRPDNSTERHYFNSTLGWGAYDCGSLGVNCSDTYCGGKCDPDAWWLTEVVLGQNVTNALHGREQSIQYYTSAGALLRQVVPAYIFSDPNPSSPPSQGTPSGSPSGCRPSWLSASPATNSGTWDYQLVSDLDANNPVAVCDIQTQSVTTYTYEGTSSYTKTVTAYSYDTYGRVISQEVTSNDGSSGSATDIWHKPTYSTDDSVGPSCTDPSSCHYLIDFQTYTDSEDANGVVRNCTYTTYDSNHLGEVARVDRYTDCSQRDSAHQISTLYTYDSYGNLTGTRDPDGVAGNTSHTGCSAAGGSGTYSSCTSYDGTYHALPTSSTNALGWGTTTSFQSSVGFGQWPTSIMDPSGWTTSAAYDGLGRVTSVTQPPIGAEPGSVKTSSIAYSDWCGGSASQLPCVEVDQNQSPASELGGEYRALPAARICDTRGAPGIACAGQRLAANGTLNVQVTGQGGVPSGGVAAVVLNVTVTNTSTTGLLVVYPTGEGQPATSNINFVGGQTLANLVQVPVGSGGQVSFTAMGSATDVIVDVQGYVDFQPPPPKTAISALSSPSLMNILSPSSRICDTRSGTSTPCSGHTLASGGSLNVQVTGQGGVPTSGAVSVVINVAVTNTAATNPASTGALVVYPTGQSQPSTTNLNWSAGQTISNRVVVPVGTGGQITVANLPGTSADVIIDAFAWTANNASSSSASGSEYGAVTATRICDTRSGSGTKPSTQCAGQTLAANTTLTLQVAGLAGVPAMSAANPPAAVDVNVTVVNSSNSSGFLTIYPSQLAQPSTSDLNFSAGQTIGTRDIAVALGQNGKLSISLHSSGSADVVVDVSGYYASVPSGMAISRSFYDGMGHLVETRSFATNNQDVVRYLLYDSSGRLADKSNPYFVTAYEGPPGVPAYSSPDLTQPVTSYTYDALGRATGTTDALSNTAHYSYTIVCNAAGTGDAGCYDQKLTADPNNHQSATFVDALGRTAYEQRFTGNSTSTYSLYATTAYAYDATGALIKILHPDGVTTTSWQYDMAGRLLSLFDPDLGSMAGSSCPVATGEPAFATTVSVCDYYDQDGNRTASMDARGSAGTVYAGYDGIDRLVWRNSSNTSTGAFDTYAYDSKSGSNYGGVGKLTSETFMGGQSNSLSGCYTYAYDSRGEETNRTLTVAGTCGAGYSVATSYDDSGKVSSQTYPDGETVTNTYDSADWLSQVSTSSTSQGSTTLLTGATYGFTAGSEYGGPAGLITGAGLGPNGGCSSNGIGTTYCQPIISATWRHDALLRSSGSSMAQLQCTVMSGQKSCGYSSPFFKESRTFDPAGNAKSVVTQIGSNTDTQGFCYDEQDRLIWGGSTGTPPCQVPTTPSSFGSAAYQDSYAYDKLGRLTSGPLGSYKYGDPAHLHAVTAIGSGWTAAYDSAGNMTCTARTSSTTCVGTQTGAQSTYAADGSLSVWQNAPSNPTTNDGFLYDGQGNRVEQQLTQNGTTTTTIYIGNLEELATAGSTTTTTTYYYANGIRIAMAVNGAFTVLGSDDLRSVVATSGQAFALFDPYGNVRYSSGTMPTSYGFTGQHSDSATGLDYYNARYYDPQSGQFTSPDSVLPGNGFDMLGLSRYSYVEGNPETRTDPTGHCSSVACYEAANDPNATQITAQLNSKGAQDNRQLTILYGRQWRALPKHAPKRQTNMCAGGHAGCSAAHTSRTDGRRVGAALNAIGDSFDSAATVAAYHAAGAELAAGVLALAGEEELAGLVAAGGALPAAASEASGGIALVFHAAAFVAGNRKAGVSTAEDVIGLVTFQVESRAADRVIQDEQEREVAKSVARAATNDVTSRAPQPNSPLDQLFEVTQD